MLNDFIVGLHNFLGKQTTGFHLIVNVSCFWQKNSQTIKSQKQLLYKFITNTPFLTGLAFIWILSVQDSHFI